MFIDITLWDRFKESFIKSLGWSATLKRAIRACYDVLVNSCFSLRQSIALNFNKVQTLNLLSLNKFFSNVRKVLSLHSLTIFFRSFTTTLVNSWSKIFKSYLPSPFKSATPANTLPTRRKAVRLKKEKHSLKNSSQSTLSITWTRLTGFLWTQGLYFVDLLKRTWGEGFIYFKGVVIVLVADALIVDDEPLWEPVEWSMAQAWILVIFLLAWIAENLIVSRYGSYTGRDKRVWFAWYKTFWLIDLGFVLSLGAAIIFVMIPFYYELNYLMSFTTSWWNWYTRVFFFKFLAFNLIVLLGTLFLQIKIRTLHWKSAFILVLIVNLFFSYLLYTHFFLAFFSYFTHVNWYNSTRLIDYVQLSHEPNKWSWGAKKRDHFSYHKSSTVFWFKNDGPFAAASMLIQFLFFVTLFLTFFYWLILLRRIYSTQEFSFTYTIYAISALKQFFFFFFLLYLFVLGSYLMAYWRFPIEFTWVTNPSSWFTNLIDICLDYPSFFISIFWQS